MKIFLFIKIILTFLILQNFAYSKGLPPGTGSSDIPANVLILLDKSGSMTIPISDGTNLMKPQAVAVDSTNSASYIGMSSFILKVGYDTMEIDDSWAFASSGNCSMGDIKELRIYDNKLYVLDGANDVVFRIDLTSKLCDWNKPIANPISMDIKNNILYATGTEMVVYDLSNATPLNKNCTYNGNLKSDGQTAKALAIDSSGLNLYFHNSGKLKRYEIDPNNKCPSTARSNEINTTGVNINHGFIFKPGSDTEIYMPDYEDELYKFTLNSAKNAASSTKASAGYSSTSASTINPNRINLDWPYGIDIDSDNERIHFVSRGANKHAMHVMDYDMQFIKEITGGNAGAQTRMEGAVEAIQEIMNDGGLTSYVNFGFGVWSESGGSFTGWNGDITDGTATPCPQMNCLKVRVHTDGAAKISAVAPTIIANGVSTYSKSFADLAKDYYLSDLFDDNGVAISPIDPNLDCQDSYIVVIGDGAFSDGNNLTEPINIITNLRVDNGIKTHVVAYGGGIEGSDLLKFKEFAVAGGTENVILANTATSLKTQLKAKITQIIADNFAFTVPSIPPNKNETSNAVYQSSFKHRTNEAWRGALIKTVIDANGNLDLQNAANWDAKDVLPNPDDRKIWSIIPNTDYTTDYNNFIEANSSDIAINFKSYGNPIEDYHSVSNDPLLTRRCVDTAVGIEDGVSDDTKGLINFLRGKDYFDYDGDCDLTETRVNEDGVKSFLGDFYHSELLTVGPPDANTSFTNKAQEAYWRSSNGYKIWAASPNLINRKEIIYVGANDGMLHAFNSENGFEEWAFIPPLLFGKLPLMADPTLNKASPIGGGTQAKYGVDGSPVVHDMYIKHPISEIKDWYTILFVPYGRGGNGFSILDVTNPDAPLHLLSIFNETLKQTVYVLDHDGDMVSHAYVSKSYEINQLKEAKAVTVKFTNDEGNEVCDNTGDNQCYLSNTWTLVTNPKMPGLTKLDFEVTKDVTDINFDTAYNSDGDIVFTFDDNMRYVAYDGSGGGDMSVSSSNLTISINADSAALGVQAEPGYDYSRLGQTWSQPRIIRMPNFGPDGTDVEDNDIDDDNYVAVLGGGFSRSKAVGSNLFIINLEVDPVDQLYGKIQKQIHIEDLKNEIPNSTPALPVVITADEISSNFTGALVYLNDLEGKITKFNLTNMTKDNQGQPIALYDSTTLFNVGATKANGRFMYHSMDAGTLRGSSGLWMYVGTGDYTRLTTKNATIDNVLLGIRDKDFPYYRNVNTPDLADSLTKCSDTTNDATGSECPSTSDLGWVIHLEDSAKITAEPTLSRGRVLFPVFKPTESLNACTTGQALICNENAKCGTRSNLEISKNIPGATNLACRIVGTGVLSKIIIFGDKLFANIAGTADASSMQFDKNDLVSIKAGISEVESFRNSWRENY